IEGVTGSLAQNLRPGEEPKPAKFRSLSIRTGAWKKLYSTIQNTDSDGIASLIAVVAQKFLRLKR
ncbi:hypothetical protein C0993_002902, partial [Termitomyces sp. T159_Od127]